MSGFFVSLLFSVAVQLLRYGITAIYEARKLRRPNLRDKEGTRAYLENLLRWAAYIQRSFFSDLATPAFTLGILLEIVKPGAKWDAFYAALAHDFNITTEFPPGRCDSILYGATFTGTERENRIDLVCSVLRNEPYCGEDRLRAVSDLERQMVEEYLAVVRRLLDHPAVLEQSRKTYFGMASP